MPQKLVTFPVRVGVEAARFALRVTARLAGSAIDLARSRSRSDDGAQSSGRASAPGGPARPKPSSSPSPPRRRAPSPDPRTARAAERAASNGPPATPPAPPSPPPAPATPPTPPAEQPDTPLSREQAAAKTIDDTPEVVAERADRGAEDGAGAQLDIEPPWEGYDEMTAAQVGERLAEADAAAVAIVELYERGHKKRATVLAAATRRLRALSPPGG
jgi:hypothetical protein